MAAAVASAVCAADDGPNATDPVFHGAAEVTASRIAPEASDAGRREVIVTRAEIEALPVQSVHELLAALPGIGLARRGARGVQGDLNIRGATFEQSVVMINGVRVSNPQTGHHNLDLFIPLEAVERVEVLFGPGTAVHGPDVFGGAVNIVTRIDRRVLGHIRFGENNLAGGALGGAHKGFWGAVEREVHAGFRENTEADVNQGAFGYRQTGREWRFDAVVLAGRRRFGAHAFYSTRFPDQWEATERKTLVAGAGKKLGPHLWFTGALRVDRHGDDFVLDRWRPEWYRNIHDTSSDLISAELRGDSGAWRWVTGIEAARDSIDSSNLGRHNRDRTAVFVELGRYAGAVAVTGQLRVDRQDVWGTRPSVAFGGRWQLLPTIAVRASAGTSLRAPSFTDLYYDSPSTMGNPALEPERGHSYEIGLEAGSFEATVFRRIADPIIDYLRDDDGVWRADNAGRVTTTGIELGVAMPTVHRLIWQRIGVSVLTSDADVDPDRSAYALRHPRVEAAWTGAWRPARTWRVGWTVRYRDPVDLGSWMTLDGRVGTRVTPQLWIDLDAGNVFDRDVTELHGVPLPGRWVTLTLTWQSQR